jgi:hypothetical protein
MKEDAELVYIKYEKKLAELEGSEKQVNERLNARLAELDGDARNIKAVLFDAKLQFRSNEMKEETYQQIKVQTDELIEHINNERTEIGNVRNKLAANTIENLIAAPATAPAPAKEEAPADEQPGESAEAPPVEQVAASGGEEHKPEAVSANGEQAQSETSWLNKVITK